MDVNIPITISPKPAIFKKLLKPENCPSLFPKIKPTVKTTRPSISKNMVNAPLKKEMWLIFFSIYVKSHRALQS
jgi:hypothetical protein